MAEYRLYCFGESGNCYKAALMLQLSRMDWEQIHVDYFDGDPIGRIPRQGERDGGGAGAAAWTGEDSRNPA